MNLIQLYKICNFYYKVAAEPHPNKIDRWNMLFIFFNYNSNWIFSFVHFVFIDLNYIFCPTLEFIVLSATSIQFDCIYQYLLLFIDKNTTIDKNNLFLVAAEKNLKKIVFQIFPFYFYYFSSFSFVAFHLHTFLIFASQLWRNLFKC